VKQVRPRLSTSASMDLPCGHYARNLGTWRARG
jgi:hypothetical protein